MMLVLMPDPPSIPASTCTPITLTPYLSSLWLALVTPAAFEVGRHLIEGLKNPTVVRDKAALEVFPIRPIGIREAIRKALTSSTT